MAKELKISGIVVLKTSRTAPWQEIIDDGNAQTAGTNPLYTDIPNGDTVIHGAAGTLQTKLKNSKANPPTATIEDVRIAANNVVDMQNENAGWIQTEARKAAKAAGDVNVGINFIKMVNYKYKQPSAAVGISFSVTAVGGGAVEVDTKAPGTGAVYIRKYGKAEDENIVPKDAEIKEYLVSREGPIRIDKLEKKEWYAFCEATIMPIPRPHVNSGNWAQAPTQAEEKSTQALTTSTHRRTFINGDDSNYEFGPWIWIVVS